MHVYTIVRVRNVVHGISIAQTTKLMCLSGYKYSFKLRTNVGFLLFLCLFKFVFKKLLNWFTASGNGINLLGFFCFRFVNILFKNDYFFGHFETILRVRYYMYV